LFKYTEMDDLFIKRTNKSPEIYFKTSGELRIEGISVLENTYEFYKKPISWLKNYILGPAAKTRLDVILEFFSTSSQVYIYEIISLLSDLKNMGFEVEINWFYSDEDFKELGQDLSQFIGIPFSFYKIDD